MDAVYHLLVITAAVAGLFRGWRLRLTGQVSALLGVGFGVVCAHIFSLEAQATVQTLLPTLSERPGGTYVCAYTGGAAVFIGVYMLFGLLTGVLRNVMEGFGEGLANSLAGSVFCAFRYLLIVGLAYDALFCVSPTPTLRHCALSDDGNVVHAVMSLAPVAAGCPSLEEYLHLLELERARTISAATPRRGNQQPRRNVIPTVPPVWRDTSHRAGPQNHIQTNA